MESGNTNSLPLRSENKQTVDIKTSSSSQTRYLTKVIKIIGLLPLFILFGVFSYYIGVKNTTKKDEVIFQGLNPTPLSNKSESVSESSFIDVKFRGHYYNQTPFDYQYPKGWHVWYDMSLKESGGPDDIVNKINLNPIPYEISESGNPAITGVFVKYNNSLNEVFDPSKPCPVPAGENGQMRFINFYCIENYKPTRLDYTLQNSESYCYRYKQYEGDSGWNKEYITCVVPIKDKLAFKFTLNDMNFIREFQHFVESIKTLN